MSATIAAQAAEGAAREGMDAALAAARGKLSARGMLLIAGLVALANWLLYVAAPGIGLVVFMLALMAGALAANPLRATRGARALAAAAFAAGLLPYAVNPSLLSFLFACGGLVIAAVLLFADPGPAADDTLLAARRLAAGCLVRAPVDVCNALIGVAGSRPRSLTAALVVWFVPVTLGGVFALLFVSANPLIASWVSAIELRAIVRGILDRLDAQRIAFSLMIALLVWPVIFVREHRRRAARQAKPEAAKGSAPSIIGDAAILRSLIVFNALFAVQTGLDAVYLWGGVALPHGMSHAEYAHRGAYPLIVTALLAAAFVIIALRPGSDSERAPVIRALVFLWIGQNVWLVISSILRLDLYVAAYSLTYWRIAAFVWMVLVAIGLVLILARIALWRSSGWLIGTNLAALTLVLYVCAFPNFAGIIADYNVAHSLEMGGGGPALDQSYLRGLGRQAIPAADILVPRMATDSRSSLVPEWRDEQLAALAARDWRSWNYWDWRLERYLERNAAPQAPAR